MMDKRNIAISENQDISEKLSILIDAAVNEIPGIEKIYLFGSYAYGKPSGESDLDLMVITDKEIEDAILSVTEIRYNTWGKIGVFDMLVYSEKVFNDRKEKYHLENKVFNEGKLIYERIRDKYNINPPLLNGILS
jgi:predicted nucleotidyltransferase